MLTKVSIMVSGKKVKSKVKVSISTLIRMCSLGIGLMERSTAKELMSSMQQE